MTYGELINIIDRTINAFVASAGEAASVPIITGRLRSSIKVKGGNGDWTIYMDEGGMTLEEWEDTANQMNLMNLPMGFAPYADKVNQRNPYFYRMALLLYNNLRAQLTGGESPFTRSRETRG